MRARILKTCATLVVLSIAAGDYALGQDATPALSLLQPADSSNPRAVLRSFVADADFFISAAMRGEEPSQESLAALLRASKRLDFSNTPNGDLVRVQIERVVLLKEVLDRLELPEEAAVPGSTEVADGAISSWVIPGTRIRIERVESGRRAGEFLFSAETVEQLLRLYRLVEDLPYRPGATEGAYVFLTREAAVFSRGVSVSRRLRPADTSTPRTVIQEFLKSVNQAYALVLEAEERWNATPRSLTSADATRLDTEASQLIVRAATALDLSEVPEVQRQEKATEAVLQLKEILDRLQLPPVDNIPDALDVAAQRSAQPTSSPIRWRVPNTPLEIVEKTDGDRQGEFLFSARSVSLLDDLYQQVADLPYRKDISHLETGYESAGLSPGFYSYFNESTGSLVPYAFWLGRLLPDPPAWLMTQRYGQAVWQWLGLVVCILLVSLIAWLVFRFVWAVARRAPVQLGGWLRLLAPLSVAGLVNGTVGFIEHDLNVTGDARASVATIGGYIEILMHALIAFLLFRAVAETIVARRSSSGNSIDASLIRLSAKVFGILAVVYVVVAGARSLGADLVPLIAGLGVGGLAVALAAQKTMANFLGSIILFAERPVREGEFFKAGDLAGTVERIGLHSTRVRTVERELVTVPNARLSEMLITNTSRRDRRLFKTVLPLRDDTSTEQLRRIMEGIRELLSQSPEVLPSPRVRFIGFGGYSEDVEVFAYLDCVDDSDFLSIREELMMRIEEIIAAAGSGFALPSQITEIRGELVAPGDQPKGKPQ